jgi:uncharacterized peroxidase-related enzyme
MKPLHLSSVENNQSSEGAYADMIAAVRRTGQDVPGIWHLFAYKPSMTLHLERLTQEIMRGPSPLSPGFRELIATLTSARNRTPFCATTHASATTFLLGDRALVESVMRDPATAPVSDAERVLLRFVEKVNREFWTIGPDDFDALRAAGWSDEAIYDAIAVCGLFNFYNRWVSANGVCQMPDDGTGTSGKRIAENGYLRSDVVAGSRR